MMLPHDMHSSIPMSALQQLFPKPVMIEEDDGPMKKGPGGPQQRGPPIDVMLQSMMEDMDEAFRHNVLPAAEQAAGSGIAFDACKPEVKLHCRGASSQLHCLGKNADTISDVCRKSISKSVPFLCSSAIDQWCDVLDVGILTCLNSHMPQLENS